MNVISIIGMVWGFIKTISSLDIVSVFNALQVVLSAIILICMAIPGEQPDKFFKGLADWIAKYSKKPKEEEPAQPKDSQN